MAYHARMSALELFLIYLVTRSIIYIHNKSVFIAGDNLIMSFDRLSVIVNYWESTSFSQVRRKKKVSNAAFYETSYIKDKPKSNGMLNLNDSVWFYVMTYYDVLFCFI